MSNDCLQCTWIKAFPAIVTMCLLATVGNDPVHRACLSWLTLARVPLIANLSSNCRFAVLR